MSKRSLAISIFNSTLSLKAELGDTKFRASVIAKVMADTGSSHASAAAMYNHAKKAAQEVGLVVEFGRKKTPAEEEAEYIAQVEAEEAITPEEEFPLLDWAVVDADGTIVDTFNSKSTAYRARNKDAGEMVKRTVDVK